MLNSFRIAMTLFVITIEITLGSERLGSRTFLQFPHALPGETIIVEKVFDKETGAAGIKSNSGSVMSADDLVKLERKEQALAIKKYGAIQPEFRADFDRLSTNQRVPVTVWIRDGVQIPYLNKMLHLEAELIADSRKRSLIGPKVEIEALAGKLGIKVLKKRSRSGFKAELTKQEIAKLAAQPEVFMVEKWLEEVPLQTGYADVSTLASSGYNHSSTPVPGFVGWNANIATFEQGVLVGAFNCFGGGLVSSRVYQVSNPAMGWEHSALTFRTMMRAAPAAAHWHIGGDLDIGTNHFSDHNIVAGSNSTGPNGSFHFVATDNMTRSRDAWAYRYPYPLISNPASNGGYQYEPGHQCYNGLSVGNVRHTGQTHFEMVDVGTPNGGLTQTKNPAIRYGGNRDRELPNIVAPGYPYTGGRVDDPCVNGSIGYAGGTSFSAPVITGIAGAVVGADGRMRLWPEKVKVALLATARNVHDGDFMESRHAGVDGLDGAGVVHGAKAVEFAINHTEVNPSSSAAIHGLTAGYIYPSDFSSGPLNYNILIPNPKPAGEHLKVVLVWDSNVSMDPVDLNALSDLDLSVTTNSGNVYSSSWDDNVEIVEVPASQLTPGATYSASLIKYLNRIPSDASFFYFAIGWTWVKDHAD